MAKFKNEKERQAFLEKKLKSLNVKIMANIDVFKRLKNK
mgnify:CR=1 FL=1